MNDLIVKGLLREFLIRRNLNDTIKVFDQEFPCSESLTRIDIINQLGLGRIIKRNQESLNPFKTVLETLIAYIIAKKSALEAFTITTNAEQIQDISNYQPTETVSRLNKMKKRPQSEYRQKIEYQDLIVKQESIIQPVKVIAEEQIERSFDKKQDKVKVEKIIEIEEPTKFQISPERKRSASIHSNKDSLTYSRGSIEVPKQQKASANYIINKQPSPEILQISNSLVDQPEQKVFTFKRKSEQIISQKNDPQLENDQKQYKLIEDNNNNNNNSDDDDINSNNQVFEDIEYQTLDIYKHQVDVVNDQKFDYNKYIGFDQKRRKPPTKPITQDIKKLLFQQGNMAFLPKSWSQSFQFMDGPTFFGLRQLEGGPCGVLACVQAFYLKHYLFLQNNYQSLQVKQNCLIAALSDILYKVNPNQLVLAVATRNSMSQGNQAVSIDNCDQIEYSLKSFNQLYEILLDNQQIFFNNHGVVLFFYSVLLSKGVETIQSEMDTGINPLIGNHGHCTQESVNLMLTGKACSNCFDRVKQIDDLKLYGITEQSEIGFLTIFEHFQYMEVGKYLKEPKLPIWVMCKEYHYSVIFGCSNNVILNTKQLKLSLKQFDLVFYDGLNNSEDLIRLTIRRLGAQKGIKNKKIEIQGVQFDASDKTTPLIELVLKTKYGDLELDWNESMPIL